MVGVARSLITVAYYRILILIFNYILCRSSGHIQIVRHLLGKGVDIEISNGDGYTPLHFAANGGHVELLKLLLENGADINRKVCYRFGQWRIQAGAQ